ncbi:sterol transfer protein [Pseudohyphozyma bogoriensis]|nr:sterol transfer protein [Pseudohyphozyma bogoriensis]
MTSRLSINTPLESRLLTAALTDPKLSTPTHTSSRLFVMLSLLLASPSSPRDKLVKQMRTSYLFVVKAADGVERAWLVDMKKKGKVTLLEEGERRKADVTIWVGDKDLIELATGKAMPQKLFAAKRIRVRGNLDRALNVERVLSHEREKFEASFAGTAPPDGPKKAQREKGGRWMGMKAKAKL